MAHREIGIRTKSEVPAIELQGISKNFRLYRDANYSLKEKVINFNKRGYDLFWALRGIDLTINKGETISIIGPNGSGKSTLLRIMTRIMSPTEGRINTHGTIAAMLELGAGFHPDLTGRENIYLNASILGFKRRMIAGIIDEIIAFSELGPFVENQVKNYSTGMYVRLGFSVAINLNPDILLVDEVLAVGDEAYQTKCLNRIARMQQEGKTIVLVTHSAGIAESISDRVLWLEKGVQKMLGDPHEVIDSYHEAMRQHPEGSEFGTRDILINRVELLDGEGREAEEFETGDPLTLRMHYEAINPVDDPVFGFGFYDPMGFMVYGTNTRLRGIDIDRVEGRNCMDFRVPSLSLLDGRYYVSVAAHSRDGTVNYHWLDKRYFFEVHSPGREEGYFAMECDISMTPE
jgi:ABC-type polysaccharide/polyol phosphate transport system ATPase subunit